MDAIEFVGLRLGANPTYEFFLSGQDTLVLMQFQVFA